VSLLLSPAVRVFGGQAGREGRKEGRKEEGGYPYVRYVWGSTIFLSK
jgi:hypothetical protein